MTRAYCLLQVVAEVVEFYDKCVATPVAIGQRMSELQCGFRKAGREFETCRLDKGGHSGMTVYSWLT
jgi:hypothetical protein